MNVYTDLNQKDRIAWFRKKRLCVHDKPYEIFFSVVSGCNRACAFCGIGKDKKGLDVEQMEMMSWNDFSLFMEPFPKTAKKFCFAGGGEPLWNPDILKMISLLRAEVPGASITVMSNGDPLIKGCIEVEQLLDAGVNYLHLDIYSDYALHNWRKYKKSRKLKEKGLLKRTSGADAFTVGTGKEKAVLEYDGRKAFKDKNTTRTFHWWMGAIPFGVGQKYFNPRVHWTQLPLEKTCSMPFKHVAVLHDGRVTPCCVDMLGSLIMGNLHTESLEEVWTGSLMQSVRFLLKKKRRDLIKPCALCSHHTFRDGVYPYWGERRDVQVAADLVDTSVHLNEVQMKNIKLLEGRHAQDALG